jgi:hypothetical protein
MDGRQEFFIWQALPVNRGAGIDILDPIDCPASEPVEWSAVQTCHKEITGGVSYLRGGQEYE